MNKKKTIEESQLEIDNLYLDFKILEYKPNDQTFKKL